MDNMREIIYSNLCLKPTEELIEIRIKNNKEEWTELALEIVKEILIERLGEEPNLNNLAQVINNNQAENEILRLRDLPEFYNPKDVLLIEKWLKRSSIILIILLTISNFYEYQTYYSMASSFLRNNNISGHFIAILIIIILAVVNVLIYFFPTKAIGSVLKILMENEFDSQKL